MRILIRTSKTARWARRIASFALPLTVLPVFMHRERLIGSDSFHLIEQAALLVAVAGILVSLLAFARLWNTGDRGWGKAVSAFLISIACILPVLYGLTLYLRYPQISDMATDTVTPLPLLSGLTEPARDVVQREAVALAFPNVRSRRYPLDAQQMFALVARQVGERGWEVRVRREPVSPLGAGQINAVVTTLFGWRDEVALRVLGDPEGSSVDMRSASVSSGGSDLGANGTRIEEFLTALDSAVTLMLRDNPTVTTPVEPEPEPPEAAEGEAAG